MCPLVCSPGAPCALLSLLHKIVNLDLPSAPKIVIFLGPQKTSSGSVLYKEKP